MRIPLLRRRSDCNESFGCGKECKIAVFQHIQTRDLVRDIVTPPDTEQGFKAKIIKTLHLRRQCARPMMLDASLFRAKRKTQNAPKMA
jgi:hypothetical protein